MAFLDTTGNVNNFMTPHTVALDLSGVTNVCYIYHLWNFELLHALSIAQSYIHISLCPQEYVLLLYVVDGKKWSVMFSVVS